MDMTQPLIYCIYPLISATAIRQQNRQLGQDSFAVSHNHQGKAYQRQQKNFAVIPLFSNSLIAYAYL